MSTSSDQSTGYFGGLIVGFVSLAVFGMASWMLFNFISVKKPVDRAYEGDFSEKRIAERSQTLKIVKSEQNSLVDQSKLEGEFAKFKATPPAATSIPFPGSATALKATQPQVDPAAKPNGEEDRPKGDPDKPKGAEDKPKGAADKPKGNGDKPKGAGKKPKGKAKNTKGAGNKPKEPAAEPEPATAPEPQAGDAAAPSGDAPPKPDGKSNPKTKKGEPRSQ